MPLRPISSDLMSEQREENISALQQQVEELTETIENLREIIRVEDGELVLQAETIRLEAETNIVLTAGNECTVTAMSLVRIDATGRLELNSSTTDVTTGAHRVSCALSTYSGIVQCQTLQTDTVIATTYTPGAGNVW